MHVRQSPSTETVLTFADALSLVLREAGRLAPRAAEALPLGEAHTRILAETVHADRDQPPFDRSTRDGFAVNLASSVAASAAQRPTSTSPSWRVVGEIFAGQSWRGRPLEPGEAVEIMTGAPVPEGADAVVMIEHVLDYNPSQLPPSGSAPASSPPSTSAPRTITLEADRSVETGANIVPRGREAARGAAVLSRGVALGPAEIALAASAGTATVEVFLRPRVAIISTGDELVELGDPAPLLPHQIRNSNSYALAALVAEAGGKPWRLPIARDTRESLHGMLEQAHREADLILLTGGVSMGKHDLVEDVLQALGASFHFTGVRMQPGKPVVFGALPGVPSAVGKTSAAAAGPIHVPPDRSRSDAPHPVPSDAHRATAIPFFGLPGNPISTEVTFRCFVAPVLRALAGEDRPTPRFVLACLRDEAPTNPALTRLLPARLEALSPEGVHDPRVSLVRWQGSGDLASNARANCYALLHPAPTAFRAGDLIPVLLR